jgi:hypothetical protein
MLAALLSRTTESVAAKTGDMIGGLLNATLGNLTELIITLARCVPVPTMHHLPLRQLRWIKERRHRFD